MAGVSYENVTKTFEGGSVVAVNDLDLQIPDKEFMVLVGPSGCGKTTTLRCLAGLDELTEGDIYIGDRLVNDVPPKDRDIAMVFQSYALYPHMSVYGNMAFGLKLRGTPRQEIERRVNEAAELLGIQNLLDRKPKQLSGGQRQRTAVGRAIVRDPNVFLMDEPLSNLDAKLRVEARAELSKLHKRLGTTWIYVTHDQIEAMTMGTRIAVMNDGVLQQVDPPQVLYDEPANLFVAGFIGSPAMNFTDGRLVERDGQVSVDCGEFVADIPEDRADVYRRYLGKEIVFGIRPDDVHDADYVPPRTETELLEAQVDVVELMGDEVIVHLVKGDLPFLGRFDPRTNARVGADMQVALNMENFHIFDRRTEEAIR